MFNSFISVMFLVTLSLLARVNARCDNQCSGHGVCMTDDVCQCYDNFGSGLSHDSGDCSDRICPYEIAWVDSPNSGGVFHKYMECAGKGLCDIGTGECQCFDGFEGKGCQRAMCPNDCSGHGKCDFIEDLTYGSTWNDWVDPMANAATDMNTRGQSLFSDSQKSFDYNLWDRSKSRKCTCDATYGDIDCSKRLCPFGTDVLDTKDDSAWGLIDQKYQEQTILFASLTNYAALEGKTFALTFKSRLNETFTTIPIVFPDESGIDDFQKDIKLSLLKLPNGVINGVSVSVDFVVEAEALALSNLPYAPIPFWVNSTTGSASLTLVGAFGNSDGGRPSMLRVGCSIGVNTAVTAARTVVSMTGTATLSRVTQAGTTNTASVSATNYFKCTNPSGAPTATLTFSASSGALAATALVVTAGTLEVGCVLSWLSGSNIISTNGVTTITAFSYTSVTLDASTGVATTAVAGTGTKCVCSNPLLNNYGTRGSVADNSGYTTSGTDLPLLSSTDGTYATARNHRRRLTATNLVAVKIRFTGSSVQGPQNLLIVEDYKCDAGCTPKLTGLPLETRETKAIWSTIVEVTKSDFNSFECGRRGKCDYTTGLCSCFAGYVGDNCNTLTTLV